MRRATEFLLVLLAVVLVAGAGGCSVAVANVIGKDLSAGTPATSVAGVSTDAGRLSSIPVYDVPFAATTAAVSMRDGAPRLRHPRDLSGARTRISGGLATKVAKAGNGASSAGRTAARACSFSGATTVLMANGSRKPIEDVKVGDKVVATDPETGERAARRVEHVWVHDDTVLDLVVQGEVITTTEDHPFWSVTDQRFERADQLTNGELLLGASGRVIRVSGARLPTARASLAFNLSVEGIHTYHVGEAAVLVHNSCYSSLDALHDPNALKGLAPSQIDDLARNAGFEVLPGKAAAANPATRYYAPGTNRSVGFRVLPGGVAGQSGVKGGAYLRYFGGRLAGQRVPLAVP